jgi:hypothetical protein
VRELSGTGRPRQHHPLRLITDALQTHRMNENPLETLRTLCMALPETTERLSHGEPTWFVRGKKTFVMYADHHHDDRLAFWCAAPTGAQQALIASEPERFFAPPYVGHRGWLGIWLDVPVDWGEIEDLVVDAYRVVAPRRLLDELDARTGAEERRTPGR